MPGPLSATEKAIAARPSAGGAADARSSVTPPVSVNLTPLPARLISTWRSRAASTSHGRRHVAADLDGDVDALGVGAGGEQLGDLLQQRFEIGRLGLQVEPAASILEKSSMSSTRASSASPEEWTARA